MEQEQEVKSAAPEPEVTQSNEEDSDDDVIAPSGAVGSGKRGRQRLSSSQAFFLCRPLRQTVLSERVEMCFWPVTSQGVGMRPIAMSAKCFLLLLQNGEKAPVPRSLASQGAVQQRFPGLPF